MTMKKHFLYLSTAALLAMSFASCVDNDEPKGLEYLRYARANKWDAEAEKIRAEIYGDSLLQVYTAVAKDLSNKAAELVNIKQEALDKLEIEKKTYQLAVDKAIMDVELAQAKYDLVRASEDNEKALEQFKADLIAKQIIAKTAQEELDQFNAEAANRLAEINANIKSEEARIKNLAADAQDALNRNKLYAENLAAQLEADTYKANLDNLMIIAAAKKDVWATAQNEVWDAYSNLKTKQTAMLNKQQALFEAQQNLLIAINGYEKDSATNLKTLKDAVNDKQYALDWAEKAVTLAEKELADFNENSKANKETWTKKYNEYQKALDGLENQEYEYDVQIAEAKAKYSADSLKYVNAKDEIEKPLTEYNDKNGYYTFILDDAIADDENFTLPAGANKFTFEQGVIANKKPIKNSDLNAQLAAILEYIGDDDASSNTFYQDETGIKNLNADIKASEAAIDGIKKQFDADSAELISKIDAKKSEINTKTQELAEYKNQNEIETKFQTEEAAFLAAAADYKAKAIAYKWSIVANGGSGKSTYYELTAAPAVAAAIVAFNKAYYAETQKDPGDQDFYNASLTTLRKAIQDKAKSKDYWDLRTAFDGTVKYEKDDETIAKNFFLFNNWTNDLTDPENIAVSYFDGYVLATNMEDPDADEVNGKVDVLLGGNDRKQKDGGAYKIYFDAASDFIGAASAANDQYVSYTKPQIAQMTDAELGSLGTTGEYNLWLRAIASLEDEIAKAKSDDTDADDDGDYDNPGIAQFEEQLAEAQVQRDKDVADEEEKIEDNEEKIANSAKWKELYDAIEEVKDANDDQIKELTIAQQEAYNTKLTSFEAAVTADQKAIDELDLAKGIVSTEKKYKKIAQGAYKNLVLKEVSDNNGAAMTGDDIEAEVIIKYAVINLQFAIDQAKEGVEDAKIELENAKKDLEDFKAGEYDASQNNYLATVTAKDTLVKEAELDYEHAVKEYEVAQTYYDEVLAAVEAE